MASDHLNAENILAEQRQSASRCLPGLQETAKAAWAVFDANWYMQTYRNLLEESGLLSEHGALQFYLLHGIDLRHSPNPFFDEIWYRRRYLDVDAAVKEGIYESGFAHYYIVGFESYNPHWLFAEEFYRYSENDLTQERLDAGGYQNGYDHYLRTGDLEGRTGHWFFEPERHRDVSATGGAGLKEGEFVRFLRSDMKVASRVALSGYFDPAWYLLTYPAVASKIERGHVSSALHHYLSNNTPQDYDPNHDFSESYYRSVHIDVAEAVDSGRFRNFYDHFVKFGALEGRRPHPDVDLYTYSQIMTVKRDVAQGLVRDFFLHFRLTGGTLDDGRSARPDELTAQALYNQVIESELPRIARRPIDFSTTSPVMSVIMVVNNRFPQTIKSLSALRDNIPLDLEVVLVDSGSKDETLTLERYVKGMKIIRFKENIGFVLGCNAALQQVTADTLLFINNDIVLDHGAGMAAYERLWSEPHIGAVGAKIIRLHCQLQEAGCVVWRDGSVSGYLRNADPNRPEANFVRNVDYCSAAFLMTKAAPVIALGGFDPDYAPAYFEDADLCIRLRTELGLRTVYDPSVVVRHYEHSTTDASISTRMMLRNAPLFRKKNAAFLCRQPFRHPDLEVVARSSDMTQKRILFIEDRLPLRHIGSGFTRSNDIIHSMVSLGYHVTVFPIYKAIESPASLYRDFSETVEVIWDRELPDLETFILERRNYYHAIWVARSHNLSKTSAVLARCASYLPMNSIILDTEAVAALRLIAKEELSGVLPSRSAGEIVADELRDAFFCQRVVTVNEIDRQVVQEAGFDNIDILGHMQDLVASGESWSERTNLLFFGAIHDPGSPNLDGLRWLASEVLPILDEALPWEVRLTIAGYIGPGVDLSFLSRHRRVKLVGMVDNISALYEQHRVVVIPTRYAGGMPYKLHEAAAHGVPVITTDLLRRQVGWTCEKELLCAAPDRPEEFSAQIVRIYQDPVIWSSVRAAARARVQKEHSRTIYRKQLQDILDKVMC